MFKNSSNQPGNRQVDNSSSPDRLNRIVSGTKIEGEVTSDSNIRIDGEVKGNVHTSGRLVIGASGNIEGEVHCENAEIEGNLVGKIHVNGLLTLKSTAKLDGDILTAKLAIEPGAVFMGTCKMGAKIKEMSRDERAGEKQQKEQQPKEQSSKERTTA